MKRGSKKRPLSGDELRKKARGAFTDRVRAFVEPFRVADGAKFRLSKHDPAESLGLDSDDKPLAKAALEQGVLALSDLQDRLYAQDRWAVLVIFQAMDAAGKDSAIKHVMSGVNPQSSQAYSFKAPSREELSHDYLWRCSVRLPERGRIGIFNRSYYEDVLVPRVRPDVLALQKVPEHLLGKKLWQQRFKDIRAFERYLTRNGILIIKFFLHVSKEEQSKRLLARLDERNKHWKFHPEDLESRDRWDDYMGAYEDMIRNTTTEVAPWYVVPADKKWFTRLVVAAAIVDGMNGLDLRWPKLDEAEQKAQAEARKQLMKSGK